MDDARTLFGRHLDLTPLGKRSSGNVRCIFHPDTDRPGHRSLSVDLDKGVYHCFGCGAEGGLRDFARAVGESEPQRRHPFSMPLATEWRAIFEQAEREGRWADEWRPLWLLADVIRNTRRLAGLYRALGHSFGPDHPDTWRLLERAALLDTQANNAESELDALMERIGRLPLPARP